MDALKASPVSLRPFVGFYCALHLCRICTLPMLKGFFAFFKKRLCQRSEYVFSLPAFSKFTVWSNCKKSHLVWFFLLFFIDKIWPHDLEYKMWKEPFYISALLKWLFSAVLACNNLLFVPINQFSIYQLIPMFWDKCGAEKWLAFLYYDRCLKPICCPSHILLKGCPWEPLIWWTLSNSFVQTKRLGKVNHLPQPRGLGWFFVCESSKA